MKYNRPHPKGCGLFISTSHVSRLTSSLSDAPYHIPPSACPCLHEYIFELLTGWHGLTFPVRSGGLRLLQAGVWQMSAGGSEALCPIARSASCISQRSCGCFLWWFFCRLYLE